MRPMLECAVTLLRSLGGYSAVAESLVSRIDELAKLRRMTLFAPGDLSVTPPLHLASLRLFVVPDRLLTHADLLRAPRGTELPSLHPCSPVAITSGGAGIRTKSGSFAIREPDLAIVDERIAIHGVERSFLAHLQPILVFGTSDSLAICSGEDAAAAMWWIEAPSKKVMIDLD